MAHLLDWLSSLPPGERDAAIERYLAIATPLPSHAPPGDHLIGYHPSGVAPIVQALLDVPVVADDVLVDLGAGLGKVVMLARLLTGATARGIEIQQALVDRARAAASALDIDVRFTHGDVRDTDLDDGTVFFLYAPFTGPVLERILERLHAVAKGHPIVVCVLGMDLHRDARWLVPRPTDAFWLTIYDSVVHGVPARAVRPRSSPRSVAETIVFERV
jgi:hypothetical protein